MSSKEHEPNNNWKEAIEANNFNSIIQQFDSLDISDQQWGLIEASKLGFIEIVKYLIEQKHVDIICPKFKRTPIYFASKHGHLNIVKYLFEIGGIYQLDLLDQDGISPFEIAFRNAQFDVVKFLILNVGISNQKTSESCLYLAAESGNLDIVQFLIENGAKNQLEKVNKKEETPLHIATINGHLKVLKYLISIGADFEAEDHWCKSAVWFASFKNHLEILKYLILEVGCSLESDTEKNKYKPFDKKTCLYIAAECGNLDIIQFLIENGARSQLDNPNSEGITPLQIAACNGNLETVKYLIQVGADYDAQDFSGRSAIWFASSNDHQDIMKYLISFVGVDFFEPNLDNTTPLHVASRKGHLEAVKLLVEEGAFQPDMDQIKNRFNPFEIAVRCKQLDVVKYFIEEVGVDVSSIGHLLCRNLTDDHLDILEYFVSIGIVSKEDLDFAFGFCCYRALKILKYLVSIGVIPMQSAKACHTVIPHGQLEILQYFTSIGIVKGNEIYDGNNALYMASYHGRMNILKHLVEVGIARSTKDQQDFNFRTPLHAAIISHHFEAVKYLVDVVGCNIHIKDPDGNTPIFEICERGNVDILAYLVEKSGDKNIVNVQNHLGKTPLWVACNRRRFEVVKYLVEVVDADLTLGNKDRSTSPYLIAKERCYMDIANYLKTAILKKHEKVKQELKELRESNQKLQTTNLALQETIDNLNLIQN